MYYFKAEAYGGQLNGSVSFTKGNPAAPCVASVRVDHVQIQQIASLSRVADVHCKGVLNGDILFKGRFDQMIGWRRKNRTLYIRGKSEIGDALSGS